MLEFSTGHYVERIVNYLTLTLSSFEFESKFYIGLGTNFNGRSYFQEVSTINDNRACHPSCATCLIGFVDKQCATCASGFSVFGGDTKDCRPICSPGSGNVYNTVTTSC